MCPYKNYFLFFNWLRPFCIVSRNSLNKVTFSARHLQNSQFTSLVDKMLIILLMVIYKTISKLIIFVFYYFTDIV